MSGKPLYNANDGLTGRSGGPYLDELEAEQAEIRRAKIEGREPDLDNPPATAGIQLNTADRMIHTVGVNSNPSAFHTFTDEAEKIFANAAADENSLLKVRSEVPESVLTDEVPEESEDNAEVVDEEETPSETPVVTDDALFGSDSK